MSAYRAGLVAALCVLTSPAWAQDTSSQSTGGVMQPNIIADRPIQITMIRPTAGQTFVVGSKMKIGIDAYDPDNMIVGITCYVDDVVVGQGGEGYECTWQVTSGTHTVKGRASNDAYPIAKSAYTPEITIYTVPNKLPTVTLTEPDGGETYNTDQNVPFTATATDTDGSIIAVDFLVDNVKVAQDTTSPYSYVWKGKTGIHAIKARAYDDATGVVTTAAHTITVNSAPTANLTEPDGGEFYNPGVAVGFTATANDDDGTINRVEFLVDGVEAGQDTTSPYAYAWTANPIGRHTVQARAFDAMGKSFTTAANTITVTSAPDIVLSEPDGGEFYNTGSTAVFSAGATDPDGTVARVEFLVDGAEVGEDTSSPYTYSWPANDTGPHTVQARAVDNLGRTRATTTRSITVDTAPQVTLDEPDGGEVYVAGNTANFSVTATDSDGTVARVDLLVDGILFAQELVSPYTFQWIASVGTHSVQARAIDDMGRATTTPLVTVTGNSPLASALTRIYTYNSARELCRVDEPETGATLMGYDAAGNLAWSASGLPMGTACDAEGDTAAILARKATRTYDARNRVTLLAFADHESDTAYTYTPTGQLETIQASNGGDGLVTTSYTYNRRDMPTHEELVIAGTIDWPVGYVYDANGHLAKQGWHGLLIDYAPNALGQATQANDYVTDVRYWPNGAIRQFTYGNGIVHTMTQNARGLPDRSIDAYGSTKILDDGYDYDRVGNVAGISDGATGQGQKGNRLMAYDDLNRLTSVSAPDMFGIASYAYDVQDNLKHVQVTAGSQPRNVDYCYDAANRLTNVTLAAATYCGGATVTGLGYDVQGNLANKDGVLYAFDQGNRLRSVSGALGAYLYDGHGRRVQDTVGGVAKRSQYTLSGQLVMSGDDRAGKVREYISLGGSLVLIRERDIATGDYTMLYQHNDALGSPVAVTTETRALVERREYEPYGYQTAPFALKDGPGYTGHVADAATGLVYMQQRYYDPVIARFLSRDAVTAYDSGDIRHFNAYDYAYNNPYTLVDEDGMAPNKAGVANASYIQMFLSHGSLADLSNKHSGNKNRYFYTKTYGWVDVRHFGKTADLVKTDGYSPTLVKVAGVINEALQWLQEWGDDYRSGFSPEDIPSNSAGAAFGEFLREHPGMTLAEAFKQWSSTVGATEAHDPKSGYQNLPDQDPAANGGDDRGSNTSSDPPDDEKEKHDV